MSTSGTSLREKETRGPQERLIPRQEAGGMRECLVDGVPGWVSRVGLALTELHTTLVAVVPMFCGKHGQTQTQASHL